MVSEGPSNKAAEGRQAYKEGSPRDGNPYPQGSARYWQWSSGWLDERTFRPNRPDRAAPVARVAPGSHRLVIVESPFAGEVDANISYARAAVADCLARGEAPFASHLLYTQDGILDDTDPVERVRGIMAGLAWGQAAAATVVYKDRGISSGMQVGINRAIADGRPVEYRTLGRK